MKAEKDMGYGSLFLGAGAVFVAWGAFAWAGAPYAERLVAFIAGVLS